MTPKELKRRESKLLQLYCGCQFGMTPHAFYAKWFVTHAQIAEICGCSIPTVDRWFSRGIGHRSPEPIHLRRLAEMDFLLEYYEQIPISLRNRLCPQTPLGEETSLW